MTQIAHRPETSINSISIATGAGGSSIAPQNLGEVVRFAEVMCKADIALPKHLRGNAGACMAVAMQAMEWRMSPFAVASKSYSVNGQIAYEAQLIMAVINTRSGIDGRLKFRFEGEGPNRVCIAYGTIDGEELDVRSPRFADITPKNSPLWKSDPDQQQCYYTARAWGRRHTPEVILGVYDREEVEQFRGSETARDVTPSLSERLKLAQIEQHEPAQQREGFNADFATSETESLSTAFPDETDHHSSAAPSADETGSGASPARTAPDPSPSEPNSDDETGEPASETADGQTVASSPADPSKLTDLERNNLIEMGRMLVAAIGPKQEELLIVFENCMGAVQSPGTLFVEKAKNIAKITRNACHDTADDKRIGKPDAVRKVALVIGCEVNEVLP
jgi:hypothetical protein